MRTTFVVFALSLASMVHASSGTMEIKYSELSATTINNSAAIYKGNGKDKKLFGYMPGGVRLHLYSNKNYAAGKLVNGMVRIFFDFTSKDEIWIERKNVALKGDFEIYTGSWPLDYVAEVSDDGGARVSIFPPGNSCESEQADILRNTVSKKLNFDADKINCAELWFVPGSKVVYANLDKQANDADYWYQGENKIFLNSIIGSGDYGSLVYGFRNNSDYVVYNSCEPRGRALGCFMFEGERISSNPKMILSGQTLEKYDFRFELK